METSIYPDELLDQDHLDVMMEALGEPDWRAAVASFDSGAGIEIVALAAAVERPADLRTHAHRLKGLCLNVGAVAMADLAHRLETEAGVVAGATIEQLKELLQRSMSGLKTAMDRQWP